MALSRNTISKWLTAEVNGPPKYRRGEQPSKLAAFHDLLWEALEQTEQKDQILLSCQTT